MKPALRRTLGALASVALLACLPGCGYPQPAGAGTLVDTQPRQRTTVHMPENDPTTSGPAVAAYDVLHAVHQAAPHATVGALVYDLAARRALLATRERRGFRSASLVKLLIAIDALDRREVTPPLRSRIHRMLAASDDDIASALWEADGGPAIVGRTAAKVGLVDTRPPTDPGMWGNTIVSAEDIGRVYRYLLTVAPEPQRRFVLGALGDAPRRAADGWDQYFGLPDAVGAMPGTDWAVKQGWSDSGDDLVLHSTGLVGRGHWRYVVVLLLSGGKDTGWAPLRAAVTAAASEVVKGLP